MTVDDILKQAQTLSAQERRELIQKLLANDNERNPKTGAEIVALLEAMENPIEFVDAHIDDPVVWVQIQRQKRQTLIDLQPDDGS